MFEMGLTEEEANRRMEAKLAELRRDQAHIADAQGRGKDLNQIPLRDGDGVRRAPFPRTTATNREKLRKALESGKGRHGVTTRPTSEAGWDAKGWRSLEEISDLVLLRGWMVMHILALDAAAPSPVFEAYAADRTIYVRLWWGGNSARTAYQSRRPAGLPQRRDRAS